MFEFDAGKLLIIGIVALIVIGPKEFPRVMRQVGQIVGKMRRMAGEFQSQFSAAMREAELAELKAEAAKIADATKVDVGFNPVADVKASLTEALQAPNDNTTPVMTETAGEARSTETHPYLTPLPAANEPVATAPAERDAAAERPSIRAALEPVEPTPAKPIATPVSPEPSEPMPLRSNA